MYDLLLPPGIKQFKSEENLQKIPAKRFILNNIVGFGCVILIEIKLVHVHFWRDVSTFKENIKDSV